MNRPESALAALLLIIAVAVPAAAQQVSLPPQPTSEFCSGCFAYLEFPPTIVAAVPAAAQQVSLPPPPMSEFCSGCFAYLEFPPSPEDGIPSSRAPTHKDTSPATTVSLTPGLVASVKQ